jgi:hypothetical protein
MEIRSLSYFLRLRCGIKIAIKTLQFLQFYLGVGMYGH